MTVLFSLLTMIPRFSFIGLYPLKPRFPGYHSTARRFSPKRDINDDIGYPLCETTTLGDDATTEDNIGHPALPESGITGMDADTQRGDCTATLSCEGVLRMILNGGRVRSWQARRAHPVPTRSSRRCSLGGVRKTVGTLRCISMDDM